MESNSAPVVLIVGRLNGPKEAAILSTVRLAAPEVLKVFPKARFQIVGAPVNDRHREIQAQFPFVTFEGHQQHLRPYYESADLVLGAGRVALEAMALRRPVVAIGERAYIGPILEPVIAMAKSTNFGDCLEREEFDWPRMSQDIIRVLQNDALREEVARVGHRLVQDEYKMEKIYPQIEGAYQQAILRNNLAAATEIPILMYHRVVEKPPRGSKFNLYVTSRDFERQLQYLQRHNFQTITFSDLLSRRLPKKPVILTFDDGYGDNYSILWPLLAKYAMKAVIFILGDRAVTTNFWDVTQGEPEAPLLNLEQIREMAQSNFVEFGGHSMGHRNLSSLPAGEMAMEIFDCKESIEEMIGKPVICFAYPYGSYNEEVKNTVADAGYRFGVAVDKGPPKFRSDLFTIRRIPIFRHTSRVQFFKKTSGYYLQYKTIAGKFSAKSKPQG